MATRLYLNNTTPFIAPATLRGAWNSTASRVDRLLAPDKTLGGSATTIGVAETDASTSFDVLLFRGISTRLAAQEISGTLDLVVGALESNADADLHWHVHAYILAGDTNTVRATILTDYVEAAGVNEWPTSAAGHALSSAQTISTATCQDGDRLVVEVGYIARNSLTASRTGTLNYGGTGGTDLTVTSANVTTEPGFIEFSDTITFLPMSARETQLGVESVDVATPSARVSQEVVQVVGGVDPRARVSQEVVQVVGATANRLGRASQVVVQAVLTVSDAIRQARVTQIAIETIKPYLRSALTSQQVVEAIGEPDNPPTRVSQVLIEYPHEPADPPTRISQQGVESIIYEPAKSGQVSQLGVEAVSEATPGTSTARLEQLGVELSRSEQPEVEVSQLGVEAGYIRDPLALVTQLGVELLYPRPYEGAQLFQLGVESLTLRPFEGAQVYQLGVEVLSPSPLRGPRAYAYIIW